MTTGNIFIDALAGDSWLEVGVGRHITYYIDDSGVRAWTAQEKTAIEAVFAAWASVADITFERVNDYYSAVLSEKLASREDVAQAAGSGTTAYHYTPSWLGFADGFFSPNGASSSDSFNLSTTPPTPGTSTFEVLLHEIGHGLGLAHPHDDGMGTLIFPGVSGEWDTGDYGLNQNIYTVMSYNEFGASYTVKNVATPMAFDIAAMQAMYGANTTYKSGDDVYKFGGATTSNAFACIWDTGGTDTIQFEGARDAIIDLRAATLKNEAGGGGFLSTVEKSFVSPASNDYGFTIANGVEIENAIGGTGRDTITGNEKSNLLQGGGGDDKLSGAGGGDTLMGESGSDSLAGGDGDDTLDGGSNGDALDGGSGDDTLLGGSGTDTLKGGDGDDTLDGGSEGDKLEGGTGADKLMGGSGNDTLAGGDGDDTIEGGLGQDALEGGVGNDTLDGGEGTDTVSYASATTAIEVDLRKSGAQNTLAGGFDTFIGIENIIGGSGINKITGDANANRLEGGANSDTLDGGAGADVLVGGRGADTYYIDNVNDVVIPDTSVNDDIVYSTVSFKMGAGIWQVHLLGSDNADVTGTSNYDQIFGNSGNNILDGGAGGDVLWGGAGDDTYIVDHQLDNIYESLNEGYDTIKSYISYSWNQWRGFEHLVLMADGITGTGAAGADSIAVATGKYSVVEGLDGADTLDGGGAGSLYYVQSDAAVSVRLNGTEAAIVAGGHAEGDIATNFASVAGSAFADNLEGDANNNAIYGGLGDDVIIASYGQDVYQGEGGNDTLSYEHWTRAIYADLGNQLIHFSSNETSPPSLTSPNRQTVTTFETVKAGSGNDTLLGTGASETLIGNAGNDTIDGGDGNDIIDGGAGNDIMKGGVGYTDTLTYATATGGVTVSLANTAAQNTGGAGTDTISGFENLTGSDHDDTLTGTGGTGAAAVNVIDGGKGDDTIQGLAGADTLKGGDNGIYGDTVSYAASTAGVTVSLSLTTAQVSTGDASGDILSAFENVTGSNLADTLAGDAGDNVIEGLGGDDILHGGGGKDAASYAKAAAAVTVSLAIVGTKQATGGAGADTLDGFESLTGSIFDDKLSGDVNANLIKGGGGNDLIAGGAGADTLDGGANTIIGDTVSYAASSAGVVVDLRNQDGTAAQSGGDAEGDVLTGFEHVIGSDADDTLTGNDAANLLTGGKGDDKLAGGAGNDKLDGGAGDDTVEGGAGDDILIGGSNPVPGSTFVVPGRDTVSYAGATKGVVVDLRLTAQQDTKGAGKDTITGFENIIGSEFDDVLTGSLIGNQIEGGKGNDLIQGLGAESDTLDGGEGVDTVSYAASANRVQVDLSVVSQSNSDAGDATNDQLTGFENVVGSTKGDVISGNDLDNAIEGGLGDDVMSGDGALVGGIDVASYKGSAAAVTVDLAVTTQQDTKGAGKDTLSNFEGVEGSAFDDVLKGDGAGNALSGGKGNDTIEGRGGADRLDGGEGAGDTASYANAAGGVRVEFERFDDASQAFTSGQDGTFAQTAVGGDSDGDVLTGFENIAGSAYDDTLFGDAKNNRIVGGAGDDRIEGGAGDDTLDGGANSALGGDIVSYERAASGVTISLASTAQQDTRGAGKDTIIGFERLRGSTHNDVLAGSTNADVIKGDDGDDIIQGGAKADELDGGDGFDTVSYQASVAAVNVDLGVSVQAGTGTTNGDASGDMLTGFEGIIGSKLADTLTGDAGDNVIEGFGGDDKLQGGDGLDTASYELAAAGVVIDLAKFGAYGAPGSKQVAGAAGADTLLDAFENLTGSAFDDKLSGNTFDNVIKGGKGNDSIFGGIGGDALEGGEGNDMLEGGAGADTLVGGANLASGGDTVSYAGATAGVQVDLRLQDGQSKQSSLGTDADGDVLVGIENILGSAYNDTLTGDAGANRIDGGRGNDTIEGGLGDDIIIGGEHDPLSLLGDVAAYWNSSSGVTVDLKITTQQDTGGAGKDMLSGIESLYGSEFGDTLTGNAGVNTILGFGGDDVIQGGAGADRLNGGAHGGLGDTASYAGSAAAVLVDLGAAGGVQAAKFGPLATSPANGDAAGDVLLGFENVTGSAFADKLIGDGGANTLSGLAGNDTLLGGEGADLLIGGAGLDILTGGLGADIFAYARITDAGGTEKITDFVTGEDVLQFLATGFAGTTKGGSVNFVAVGGTALPAASDTSKAWFLYDTDDGRLYFDADGKGGAAAQLLLTLDTHPTLTAAEIRIV